VLGLIMSLTTEWLSDTVQLGANRSTEREVSFGEIGPESTPFLIGLLLDSIQRERASMTSIEDNMNSLRLSLIERKRAIDQQEDMLRDLSRSVSKQNEKRQTMPRGDKSEYTDQENAKLST